MGCKVELTKIACLISVKVIQKGKPPMEYSVVSEEELRLGRVDWPKWLMRMAQKKLKEHKAGG